MDILKLTILIIGATLIAIIGINIKNKFKKKYNYTLTLLEITDRLKIEISFNKKSIKEILQPYLKLIKHEELINIFNSYLQNNNCNFTLLNENENDLINTFFNNIGENNLENTIKNIDQFNIELKKISEKYRLEYNKNGSLYFKLCICLSLVFIIIFA